ncbi:carbohydrate ABC transporter permease [Vallitalea pronyensis]|uniref:Carbohydrate ABC transporter permease n=1 Tax=Vallitalea pronyensis TaxID=1348613 RepID=A0A8J8SGG3_9FIRM|nr:carbohydrate ABC transporter permease [Vallitalea pronyensis]QUI22364.1 carbohydrate ABC transporter permease [Vallitalea pronyensis]
MVVLGRNKKIKMGDVVFNVFNYTGMLFLCIVTLYPFINTIAISFNAGIDTIRGGIHLWPRVWTIENYRAVFASGTIYRAFGVSIARTVLSVGFGIFLTTLIAYVLSRKEFIFRKHLTMIFVFTMYFNAGLIPVFFLIRGLGLINNFLVYVIPGLVNAFNMIVIRTYILGLPDSMVESARIDGASEFKIFLSIIIPLCKPVLATIALFIAVGSWNQWFDTFLYASSKQELSTLQYELMKLLSSSLRNSSNASMASGGVNVNEAAKNMVTPMSIRAAITIVAAVPILVVYPFLQKHFVKGLVIGSVKE